MDAKLLYWTGALVNLGVVVLLAADGVRRIRRGEVRAHRRRMLAAGALVGLFLGSYLVKVAALGKEDRSAWSGLDYGVLYVHESCIAVMLLCGAYAGFRAFRFRRALPPGDLPPAARRAADRRGHRRAGWGAVVGAVLAFVTAAGVLVGMYGRAID